MPLDSHDLMLLSLFLVWPSLAARCQPWDATHSLGLSPLIFQVYAPETLRPRAEEPP